MQRGLKRGSIGRWFKKFQSCPFPLRTVLITPFVVQILLVVGLTGYLSYRNGQKTVDVLVSQLQKQMSDRIEQEVLKYLSMPRLINQMNADATRSGSLDLTDPAAVEAYMWDQFQQFHLDILGQEELHNSDTAHLVSPPTLIAIASETGNYVEIGYNADAQTTLRVRDLAVDVQTRSWAVNDFGTRTNFLEASPDYEPRSRPWYQNATETGNLIWIKPYIATFNEELFVAASQSLFDRQGNLLGVTSVTLSLQDINEFLEDLKLDQAPDGASLQSADPQTLFIVSTQGDLIASSTAHKYPVILTHMDTPQMLSAVNSEDELIQKAADILDTSFGFNNIHDQQYLSFRFQQEQYLMQVRPIQSNQTGLQWLMVVVIPESVFMSEIYANNRNTGILCVAALVVATGIGVWTSRWITAPILKLSQAADALSYGNWEQEIDVQRRDELGILAAAFDRMRHELKDSQTQLKSYNQDLECLILERTEKLRKSEEKFAKAFRASPEPLAIASFHNGQLIEVNDSFLQLSGYSETEVLGRTATDLNLWVHQRDRQRFLNDLQQDGAIRNREIQFQSRFGKQHTVLISAEVIEVDQADCVLFVLSDISEIKRAEAALQEAKTTAEVANQAKSTFLASMSHELRTPLNAILGFTQLMVRNPQFASASQELTIITRSGEHLLGLINDILDLSKIEAGHISLDYQSFDLYELLTTLEEMFQLRTRAKKLWFTVDYDATVPRYIYTDIKKLRQVLLNLLGNAVKFTTSGSINVYVSVVSECEYQVRWHLTGNLPEAQVTRDENDEPAVNLSDSPQSDPILLAFEVTDTGMGIAPEELVHLFDPFVQTESGRRSHQGTGLGLAISQRFAHLMGGDIVVTSQLNVGSCFRLILPVQEADECDGGNEPVDRLVIGLAAGQPTYRILIVDEVDENRLLLRKLLEPMGFEILEAKHGADAIAQWQHHHPHLIWMDMRMPVMDGYTATRQIRQQERDRQLSTQDPSLSRFESDVPDYTKIIALTASALDKDRGNILAAGCDDYVRKPFREAEIWEILAEHLGVQYQYAESATSVDDSASSSLTTSTSQTLTPESFQVMPSDWITRLHHAAISGDDMLATQLVEQIPAAHNDLAIALTTLIDQFALDAISDLTTSSQDA